KRGQAMKRCYLILVLAAACLGMGVLGLAAAFSHAPREAAPPEQATAKASEATSEQVHQLCGACHAYPPADSFPRASWRREVRQGYDFLRDSALAIDYPSLESVVRYYERRAPVELPSGQPPDAAGPVPLRFRRRSFAPPDLAALPAIANVNLVHLYDKN